jgi:capsid protein
MSLRTTISNKLRRFGKTAFGYDAVEVLGKRQAPTGILRSEDDELRAEKRRLLTSSTRDLHRNFSLVAWGIRKHLDYVADHKFQSRTGDAPLDREIESFVAEASRPENCDVTGRHSLEKNIRLAECRRVVDGDCIIVKLSDGRIQCIESDRIRTPLTDLHGVDPSDIVQGIHVNTAGRALRYAVHRRNKSTFTFERWVPAANAIHFAYIDRFDQVRGVSPLASGLNSMRDTYEGFDYALAKMKVSQLFALAIYREAAGTGPSPTSSDGGGTSEIDFGRGPMMLDLNPSDKAEFLDAKTPSAELQSFSQAMIALTLKALDIPYSFYAENFTNYSGSRQALLQYNQSSNAKRYEVQSLLNHWTRWRIGLAIQDRVLRVDPARLKWEWQAAGIPWIDPLKEIQADVQAVGAALNSRQRVLRERGLDFFQIVDELAAENAYLLEKNVATAALPTVVNIHHGEEKNANEE